MSTDPDTLRDAPLTVEALCLQYLEWAGSYYVKHGETTAEPSNIELAFRPLRRLYGRTVAGDFRPKKLKAVRAAMVEAGLCRSECNKRTGKIVRAFKWAVEEELVPPAVHHGLAAVAGLRRGRSPARETEPVKPVPDAHVDAVLLHLPGQVAAMVELQRLTGMRPGEVCIMRPCDLDTGGPVWTYRPSRHKTEHHGKDRVVYLGPAAQAIVKPWLRDDPAGYLFRPWDVRAAIDAERRGARRTPMTPSQRLRAARRWVGSKKTPGPHYTKDSYRQAIRVACRKAAVPHWHPNQLRHAAATRIRAACGLEMAQVILGHSSPATTLIYAEADQGQAAAVMARLG